MFKLSSTIFSCTFYMFFFASCSESEPDVGLYRIKQNDANVTIVEETISKALSEKGMHLGSAISMAGSLTYYINKDDHTKAVSIVTETVTLNKWDKIVVIKGGQ